MGKAQQGCERKMATNYQEGVVTKTTGTQRHSEANEILGVNSQQEEDQHRKSYKIR